MRKRIEGEHMLDLQMIENTITELEHADTNFANCEKLASLYIIREYNTTTNEVTEELSDILPHYNIYCEKKREYKMDNLTSSAVISALDTVCREIKEFMSTLYSSTDMQEEREKLNTLITDMQSIIK